MESVIGPPRLQPFITGIGLVTPLGPTADATWAALLAGRFITDHSTVPGFTGPHRATHMALNAAREAIAQANWTPETLADPNTALFVGTSKGPVEAWLQGDVGPAGLSSICESLARELRFGPGPRLTLSAACASGLHAIARACLAIASGEADRALVVASEASVHPLFLSSFKRLGVLAPPEIGCRPFDQTRAGFLMSEAAGAICIEAESMVQKSNCDAIRIERIAIGGDATHLTSSDPESKTLRRLLHRVLNDGPVDLIHAHSTATIVHDPVELRAIESVVSEIPNPRRGAAPFLYSHKGALGHSLGAAGMLSVIVNCLTHKTLITPGNIRSNSPLAMNQLDFKTSASTGPIQRSIAIATGFGGPVGAIGLVGNSTIA